MHLFDLMRLFDFVLRKIEIGVFSKMIRHVEIIFLAPAMAKRFETVVYCLILPAFYPVTDTGGCRACLWRQP